LLSEHQPPETIEEVAVAGRLEGKVALITGTGGGMGRSAALRFAAEGARIVGCDLNLRADDAQRETERLLADAGAEVFSLAPLDVTDRASAERFVMGGLERFGQLDIVYNNAADELFAPFAEMSVDEWHHTLRHELDGIFHITQCAWSALGDSGGGSIINTASLSGMRASERIGSAAHAAGKGAVIALTRQLALEGAPYGIRANAISPGPVDTPVTAMGLEGDPGFRQTYEGWTLLNRTGRPDDVVNAALFLASDEASWITGINIPVDGGWSAKGGLTVKDNSDTVANPGQFPGT